MKRNTIATLFPPARAGLITESPQSVRQDREHQPIAPATHRDATPVQMTDSNIDKILAHMVPHWDQLPERERAGWRGNFLEAVKLAEIPEPLAQLYVHVNLPRAANDSHGEQIAEKATKALAKVLDANGAQYAYPTFGWECGSYVCLSPDGGEVMRAMADYAAHFQVRVSDGIPAFGLGD